MAVRPAVTAGVVSTKVIKLSAYPVLDISMSLARSEVALFVTGSRTMRKVATNQSRLDRDAT